MKIPELTEVDKLALRRKAITRFRGGMTPYLSKLVHNSEAIRKQFVPSWEEGLDFGRDEAFEEGKSPGKPYGLERLYEDRVVITPYFDCAAYCRYCFRKTRTIAGDGRVMSADEIDRACEFILADERIHTVLITGGDPFADPLRTIGVVKRLAKLASVKNIRIGTRHILFAPEEISLELCDMLSSVRNEILPKSLSIYISLNHPDELTAEVRNATRRLRRSGIILRGHAVLLKGINDQSDTIRNLAEEMFSEEILPYYLYHCIDVTGTAHMRTSVKKGVEIIEKLATLSGSIAPQYIYVTPAGKHRVYPGSPLVYEQIEGRRFIRSHGPYSAAAFKEFTGKTNLPPLHEEATDGSIISRYLDGDDE